MVEFCGYSKNSLQNQKQLLDILKWISRQFSFIFIQFLVDYGIVFHILLQLYNYVVSKLQPCFTYTFTT